MDLHVGLKCAILNNSSKFHMMSYMALWKGVFPSKYIRRDVCCYMTLFNLLFLVSLDYNYLFNPNAPPCK